MKTNIVKFNQLTIGDVFRIGTREFIKITNAVPNIRLDKQLSNCLCLDNKHYCVVGCNIECEIVKSMLDLE